MYPALDRLLQDPRKRTVFEASRVVLRHANLLDLPKAGFAPDRTFPIVNSLGVLHHTPDCRSALEGVARYIAPGGHLHLGLYHLHGRAPFLNMFDDVRRLAADDPRRPAAEEVAFDRYCALYPPAVTDRVMLRSWYRDQVLHPFETQHTLEETCDWLADLGLAPVSTSVNEFQPVADWQDIFRQERTLGELSYQRNVVEKKYYPGFFVVVARRPAAS